MEIGLFILFWYGMLHAMGPDHLAVIADFSIGKNRRKTALITLLFAVGHGLTLFLFASLLQSFPAIQAYTHYGDALSALVIILMGTYLLYMVFTDRLQLSRHTHNGKQHTHISFSKNHHHKFNELAPVLSLGILMGIGGVRGLLVTLGVVNQQAVSLEMVAIFVLGVSTVFVCFGLMIWLVNRYYLNSLTHMKRIFGLLGVSSIVIGAHLLLR